MSERRGLWSPLASPIVYDAFHHLIGARRWMKRFAQDTIRPRPGDTVLDIGCGPGALLRYLPPSVAYIGFDRNPSYLEQARRRYGSRGVFILDDVANFAAHSLPPADIAVKIGLLHHLDDDLALGLLSATKEALKPGGRLITADPCFHPAMSALQRLVVSNDRGMHVRRFESYSELCSAFFPAPRSAYQNGHFPFPHSVCVIEAVRP